MSVSVCQHLYLPKRNMWSSAVFHCVCGCLCVSLCVANQSEACMLPAEVNKSRCPAKAEHHSLSCVPRSTSVLPPNSEKFLWFFAHFASDPKVISNIKTNINRLVCQCITYIIFDFFSHYWDIFSYKIINFVELILQFYYVLRFSFCIMFPCKCIFFFYLILCFLICYYFPTWSPHSILKKLIQWSCLNIITI